MKGTSTVDIVKNTRDISTAQNWRVLKFAWCGCGEKGKDREAGRERPRSVRVAVWKPWIVARFGVQTSIRLESRMRCCYGFPKAGERA